ncbi:hypothetical protein XMIN_458 [Xanthomonas citri pv. mangiferaeindicae LMG 941]|nr:hypothetical protein XMIN_458 [Xanthomonas citri pv. mangiferaeindicae LMG 941]
MIASPIRRRARVQRTDQLRHGCTMPTRGSGQCGRGEAIRAIACVEVGRGLMRVA